MTHISSGRSRGRVAACYLARRAEGLSTFRRFADSYRLHPAGVQHDLVVIYKGYKRPREIVEARAVFRDLPHIGMEVDDTGFDIGAYLKVAERLDHDYVCFMNSFTELEADGWLNLLYYHASRPDVGLAGAMGYYESLRDSMALLQQVLRMYGEARVKYDQRIAHYFDFLLGERRCREWLARDRIPALAQLRRWVRATPLYRFRRHWRSFF